MVGKSAAYILGLCVGILVAVVVLTVLRKRRGGASNEYDERQQMVRGKAYGAAFFTLMCYLPVNAAVNRCWRPWTLPGIDSLIGLFLAVAVFMVYAIRGDAYFSLREKPGTFKGLCLVVIACQLPNIVMTILHSDESFLTDGLLNSNCMSVACVIVFIVALVAFLLHNRVREDGEDE